MIFTSDNGPWLSYGDHAGSAGPLREGKGTTFEGGLRVPSIMRWPGTNPRRQESATSWPRRSTCCRRSRIWPGPNCRRHKIDGKDIWPSDRESSRGQDPHEAFFYYRACSSKRSAAARGSCTSRTPTARSATVRGQQGVCRSSTNRQRPNWPSTTWRTTSARSTMSPISIRTWSSGCSDWRTRCERISATRRRRWKAQAAGPRAGCGKTRAAAVGAAPCGCPE